MLVKVPRRAIRPAWVARRPSILLLALVLTLPAIAQERRDAPRPAVPTTRPQTQPAPPTTAPGRQPATAPRKDEGVPKPTVVLKPGEIPAISFPEAAWDFGRVKAGTELTHEFVFTNTGNGPLELLQVRPG